jgi:hypothetical protein
MASYTVKSGAEKEQFEAGAMRDNTDDKVRPSLIPLKWIRAVRSASDPDNIRKDADPTLLQEPFTAMCWTILYVALSEIQQEINPLLAPEFPGENDLGSNLLIAASLVNDIETEYEYKGLAPEMIWRLARHMTLGAKKYADWNWYSGFPHERTFESLMRHFVQWAADADEPDSEENIPPEEDHAAAVLFNLMCMWIHLKNGTHT